jgi:hypothetical protein
VHLLEDEAGGRALRGGEGHGDFDALARPSGGGVGVGGDFDFIDEAEIDEVQLDFGVVAVAEGGEDVGFGKDGF